MGMYNVYVCVSVYMCMCIYALYIPYSCNLWQLPQSITSIMSLLKTPGSFGENDALSLSPSLSFQPCLLAGCHGNVERWTFFFKQNLFSKVKNPYMLRSLFYFLICIGKKTCFLLIMCHVLKERITFFFLLLLLIEVNFSSW